MVFPFSINRATYYLEETENLESYGMLTLQLASSRNVSDFILGLKFSSPVLKLLSVI